jgi:hypothetical protein
VDAFPVLKEPSIGVKFKPLAVSSPGRMKTMGKEWSV